MSLLNNTCGTTRPRIHQTKRRRISGQQNRGSRALRNPRQTDSRDLPLDDLQGCFAITVPCPRKESNRKKLKLPRFCSARLQAGTSGSSKRPPEGRRYKDMDRAHNLAIEEGQQGPFTFISQLGGPKSATLIE